MTKKTSYRGLKRYALVFVLSLFVIFFIGTKVISSTGESKIILTTQGLQHIKKGLDLAGGVRLTYKIDFSKYEEAYKDNAAQLQQVKRMALNIILKNIDDRISSLGVSDYNAFVQKLTDGEYLVVEIGGVQDLEAAKKLIGKTVELEFKIPNEKTEADPVLIAERKKIAESMFADVAKDPASMEKVASLKGSQGAEYHSFMEKSLNELPLMYTTHLDTLTALESGSMYPKVITGTYHAMVVADEQGNPSMQTLKGYTIVRYLGKKEVSVENIQLEDVLAYADAKDIQASMVNFATTHVTKDDAKQLVYDGTGKTLYYVQDEVLPGSVGYNALVYQVPETGNLSSIQKSVEETVGALDQGKTLETTVADATLVASGWQTEDELKTRVSHFSYDASKPVTVLKELDTTYVVAIRATKKADEKYIPAVAMKVSGKESADKIIKTLETKVVYSFEDIYVADSLQWVIAKDPKSDEVLNGAYFKYANVSQAQSGKPVVSIQFDDKGKDIFCNITEEYLGKQMAIFVGGKLMTAPVIRDKICGGTAQIDGSFDIKGARALADDLNSGALPAPLLLSHEETVAPSLGQNALTGALIAGLIGLIFVYLLMLSLYGWKKANIALLGLIVFLVYLLGFVKLFGVVSSLSGIAAIILSLGMAVDANVLIYERMREELKAGRSMDIAIDEGYARSWAPIRDGNITTGIIGLLLFLVGVSVLKGFGTMMLINMALILLVVTPITKELLHYFYRNK